MSGAVLATVYPSSGAQELEYVLRNATPRLLLADRPRLDAVAAAVRAAAGDADVAALGVDGIVALPAAGRRNAGGPSVEPGDVALICYTSGTTAHPKPVAHTHAGLAAAARSHARVWRFSEDDRILVCIPMAWAYGLVTAAFTMLARGGAVVVVPRFNPVHVVEAIERARVTVLPAVGTIFVKLAMFERAAARRHDLSSLRLCLAGGEPRNERLFAQWRELSGCPVHDVYAATECFPVVTYDPVADPEPRAGCAGRVVPEAELRLVTPAGAAAAPGAVGEALFRGPAMMSGYWREPELTRSVMTDDGWYRSRDVVRVDEEGYVYVTGRVSDMIIRGGSNVSPAEVEAVLAEHPDVRQVAVVGLPDPEYGELVAAALVVEPSAPFDAQALQRLCRERLAPYKVPAVLRRLDDLPRNVTGKVLRRELVELLSADAGGAQP
jgi:long-chain acyl-CoA synthetase